MDEPKDEVLAVLVEIRDTLNRVYTCYEDQYLEIQKNKYAEKVRILEAMLTDIRKKIFPLLFDQRHLSQSVIAQNAQTTQPTVSRFVSELIANDLIEQVEENGKIIYHDKYELKKLLQK